jgi:hypothetical protein
VLEEGICTLSVATADLVVEIAYCGINSQAVQECLMCDEEERLDELDKCKTASLVRFHVHEASDMLSAVILVGIQVAW